MSTPQAPIRSGFGAASTADEVIVGHDLSGKVAIVTGGYPGLGLETARVLAEDGVLRWLLDKLVREMAAKRPGALLA
ncbi:hypothetical protein ACC687_39215, partial [Rhizobium ruizarguesonis]